MKVLDHSSTGPAATCHSGSSSCSRSLLRPSPASNPASGCFLLVLLRNSHMACTMSRMIYSIIGRGWPDVSGCSAPALGHAAASDGWFEAMPTNVPSTLQLLFKRAYLAEGVVNAVQQAAGVLLHHLLAHRQDLRLLHHDAQHHCVSMVVAWCIWASYS